MPRRSKVIGFGTGLVVVGLVLIYTFGLALLFHSPVLGEYRLSDPLTIEVSSRAVVTDDVELLRWTTMPEFVPPPDDIRVQGVATGSDALFMGIAPADAVAGYLDGVAHDEITAWESFQDDITDVVFTRNDGATDPAAPGTKGFWVASVSGSGEQTLDWTIESGQWALVIMNADGSPGVSADVQFGVARLSVLLPIGLASLVVGLVALIGGGRMVTSLPPRPEETPVGRCGVARFCRPQLKDASQSCARCWSSSRSPPGRCSAPPSSCSSPYARVTGAWRWCYHCSCRSSRSG